MCTGQQTDNETLTKFEIMACSRDMPTTLLQTDRAIEDDDGCTKMKLSTGTEVSVDGEMVVLVCSLPCSMESLMLRW